MVFWTLGAILLMLNLPVTAVAGQRVTTTPDSLTQVDSLHNIEAGFSGNSSSDIDYEALVRELYGNPDSSLQTARTTPAEIPKSKAKIIRGPAPGLLNKGILHGSHLAINAASPFAVATPLKTWYSFIDASLTMKLPIELDVETIPLFLLFEISSFNFENSLPEGGSFSGLAYIMQTSAIGDHAGATLGFGFWDASLGSMLELNYRLRPTTNTFFRLGTRGVLVTNIAPLGPTWWLELRLSLGLEL